MEGQQPAEEAFGAKASKLKEKAALRRFQRAAREVGQKAHPEADEVKDVQNRAGAAAVAAHVCVPMMHGHRQGGRPGQGPHLLVCSSYVRIASIPWRGLEPGPSLCCCPHPGTPSPKP